MFDNLSFNPRRWLRLFLKTGSIIGLGLFILMIIGVGYGQWWAKRNLAPIISQELTKTLKRPVNLGSVEEISLDRVRLRGTNIPANGNNLNQLKVQEVIINFNPMKLIFTRTLKLDVRVIDPSIYLPQNAQGNWVELPAQTKQPPGPVKIEVGTINIDNAQIVILPYDKTNPQPVTVSKLDLQADLDDRQSQVNFTGGGKFNANGRVKFEGQSLIANGKTQVAIKGEKLDAAAATRIVKIPEVRIDRGTVDGSLNLAIQPQKSLKINSSLLVRNGKLFINNVPRSLDEINGFIEVSEREVKFKNTNTKYDRVAGVVSGTLNYYTGYQLQAKTAPISLPDVFTSIDVKSPFPLAGAAVADLQLTGKLDRPILAGRFNNSQISQVDRVQVDRVNGNFKLADGRITLDAIAQPTLGGKIVTNGEIQLLKTPQTRFQLQGSNLPADTLTRLYGAKLPPQLKLGTASVQGTIGGAGAAIYTNLRVNAPQATYPVSTDLQITPQGKTLVRSATLQAAGGKVNATGTVTATNWQLDLQPQNLDTQKLAKIVGTTLPTNYQGKLAGKIRAAGLNNDIEIDRIQAQGNLSLQLAAGLITANSLTIDRGKWQANLSSNALDLQALELNPPVGDSNLPAGTISGNFNLQGNGLKKISPTTILAQGKGRVKLDAGEIQSDNLTIANGNWQGIFTTNSLDLKQFNSQVGGKLNGKFNLAGNLQTFTPESIRGTGIGSIDLPQGKVTSNNFQLDRGRWQGNVKLSSLVLGGLAPEIPLQFRQAKVDGDLNIAGDLQQLEPNRISVVGSGKLSLADGTISARQLELKAGKWRGDLAIDKLKLGSVSENIPVGFESARLSGNFNAAGDLDKLNPDRIQVAGNGDLTLANGKIRMTNLQLDRGDWRSNLAVSNLKLGSVTDQLPTQFRSAKLNGNFNVAGNLARLTPAAIQASGKGDLRLADGGAIFGSNLNLAAGQWQSDLSIRGLKLGSVNRQLPKAVQAGLLFGDFQAAGNLQNPSLDTLQVKGNGNIDRLLGGKLQLANFGLNKGQWQSRVSADRLNIADLAKFAPQNSLDARQLNGQLSGDLQLAGNIQDNNPAKLRVSGQTKLTNFRVGSLKFDPDLIGNIQANPGQGVDIAFAGGTDRLALSLDRNLQPQSFAVQQQGISAQGTIANQIADINVERFPIDLFQQWIPKSVGIQQYRLGGMATGNLAVNLNNFQVAGKQIAITNPIFGAFQGDKLLANFRYANGKFNLNDTEIQRGEHNYTIDASITPSAATPTFQAKVRVPKGSLEDVRDLFQIFSIDDLFTPLNKRKYGTIADLRTKTDNKIANRPQPLYNELRRLSELRRWLNRETDRQQASNLIPELRNLQGDFSGEISIASNPKTGLQSDFDIQGEKWQLERYSLDKLQVKGNWRNGKLHLDPSIARLQDSQLTLAGDFGSNRESANVKIENVPTDWLTSLVDLPVDINGNVNLTAQISGNLDNPRFTGNVSLSDAQLNQTQLKSVTGKFDYWNRRLDFDSNATFAQTPLVSQTDLISLSGSIPYQLPFSNKPPISQELKIDLNLQNQGLQMLDVFSKKQLHWIDGQGKIALNIKGKMKPQGGIDSLTASGNATISKARIQSVAIPEPLRDINGEVVFDFDRIDVRKLEGNLDKGKVAVTGVIPISDSFTIDPSNRLSVLMTGLAVNLKEKYNGSVDGKLSIEGTALAPILTGDIKLSNGQVFLPEAPNTTSTVLGLKPVVTTEEVVPSSLALRRLQLTLGDNLQITRAPILSFIATGKLDIDGTLDNLRPFGQVQLQKGAVNLFTTQFRLANGYPQTADFFPTLGTEPVLNLRLYAKTLESSASPLTQRNSIARAPVGGEINQTADFYSTSLGSVQTVQVEARIAGLASQLTQRLELTSTPPRSQPEILLLLGGGLVERIGAGDNNIGLGIANLAGSTLLNSVQDRISEALSLSDFRLFPTVTKDSKTSSNSTLGIAAEVGLDITPKISTSVFKVLTNSELLQYSLRYRLNEQILLRGSTNLYGENRAIIEFEQRF
jgi:translocation and assembly module TamB